MIKGSAGRRYARAVFDLASHTGKYDEWLQDLREIRDFLADATVAAVIQNPEVPFEKKKAIIDAGFRGFDEAARNFVYVLVKRRRTDVIDKIVDEYERLLNEHRGIAVADVVTAIPLDDEAMEFIAARLSALTGKKVTIRHSIDTSIIGGVVAKIGDRLINGSVADRLARMRERLAQA